MKARTKSVLKRKQATLEDGVKMSVKLNKAEKALKELPGSYAIETALLEIMGKRKHYDKVVKNTINSIAVIELREGI